jgi:hypothetical protein
MIEYQFSYVKGSRPECIKKFTASSGEIFSMPFGFENITERDLLTTEQLYLHLENLLQYIKDKSQGLSLIHIDEENDGDGWHLNGGWAEIDWANEEILKWWSFVYYKPEDLPEEGEQLDV